MDNLLLELIIATALRDEPGAALQANPKPQVLKPKTLNPKP